MTQVKMPEPVATVRRTPSAITYKHKTSIGFRLGENNLVTTDQAEAYAAAKVREALEQAIAICQAEGDEWDSDSVEIEKNYAHAARDRIRALIPKVQA